MAENEKKLQKFFVSNVEVKKMSGFHKTLNSSLKQRTEQEIRVLNSQDFAKSLNGNTNLGDIIDIFCFILLVQFTSHCVLF